MSLMVSSLKMTVVMRVSFIKASNWLTGYLVKICWEIQQLYYPKTGINHSCLQLFSSSQVLLRGSYALQESDVLCVKALSDILVLREYVLFLFRV